MYIYIYIYIYKIYFLSIYLSIYICQNISTSEHDCIFNKLSEEVSDLKLSKNVTAMFIFNTKMFANSTKFSFSTCFLKVARTKQRTNFFLMCHVLF